MIVAVVVDTKGTMLETVERAALYIREAKRIISKKSMVRDTRIAMAGPRYAYVDGRVRLLYRLTSNEKEEMQRIWSVKPGDVVGDGAE